MIIRFKNTDLKAEILKRAVLTLYKWAGDGDSDYNAFTLKQQIYLLDDLSLYVDDDMDEEYSGLFLKDLRTFGFLEEDADVIVPRVYKPLPDDWVPPPWLDRVNTEGEPDTENVIDLGDLHPEIYDDGLFEQEMREIVNRSWDDEDE